MVRRQSLLVEAIGGDPLNVTIGGDPVPSSALAGLTITRGRQQVDQRPAPATLSATLDTAQLTRLPVVGDQVVVDLSAAACAYFGIDEPTTNLLPNPSAEVNLAWISGGAGTGGVPTVTRSAAAAYRGGWGTRVTAGGNASAAGAGVNFSMPAPGPVVPGAVYTGSVYGRLSVAAGLRCYIAWYTAASTPISGNTIGATVNVAANTWARLTVSGVAPAGASKAVVCLQVPVYHMVPGDWLDGDAAQLEAVDHATAYTDTARTGPARRFVGKVTDAQAISTAVGQPDRVQLAAAGTRARLAQLDIGDAPWPSELDGARAARILTLAETIDPSLVTTNDAGAVTVLPLDVDKRKAGDLLDELAVTSGGELAELRDGTLAWHDANHRRNIASSVQLTPADVLAPLAWQQQLAGLLNDVTIGYGTDGGSGQATVRVVDSYAASTWPAQQTLATQLPDAAAATSRGNELVGRFGRPRWRLPQLAVELIRVAAPATAAALLGLDFGQLLTLTGFPAAGPFVLSSLFVEGATETISRNGWQLALAVSDYRATGPATRWVDVPTDVTWSTVDPADLTWLAAVAWYDGDPSQGRWVDVPADLDWQDEPAALTWATA